MEENSEVQVGEDKGRQVLKGRGKEEEIQIMRKDEEIVGADLGGM